MRNSKSYFALAILVLFASGCGSVKTRDELSKDEKAPAANGGDTINVGEGGDTATPATSNVDAATGSFAEPAKKETSNRQLNNMMDQSFKAQDWEGLQRAAINALSKNPNDGRALHALGVVNYHRKKYLAAMYFYTKALQQTPNSSEIQTNIGMVQLAMKERKEAIKAFKKAYEINPGDGVAAANLGTIYATEGDYGKAMPVLDRAVKAGIKDARVYNDYGIALVAAGKYEEAKPIYEEAMKMNNGFREPIFNYAILCIDFLNQHQAGLDALNRLRFLGLGEGMRDRINSLENKAKAGLK